MTERHLTLVGLTEDQQTLVLVSDSGEEFTLTADARLRAALREHARLRPTETSPLEITMESALRPRDIQSRIRAGESPESVAAAAQTSLEKVMGYALPVLAERAHIADRAQRASVRRTNGEGPARVLADAVAERLRGRNVDPDSVEWDAWRREDGRWTLVADYRSGGNGRHAEFVFDAAGRFVVAEDDEARWMVGEQTPVRGPQPRTTPGPRRLSAVDAGEVLPLGEDAIEMVAEDGPAASHAGGPAADDWMATQASARPVEVPVDQAPDPADGPTDGPAGGPDDPVELGSEADEPTERPAEQATPAPASKKARRPSVPSWDEIMFGGGKRD
jgi:hypothetical protein